MFVNHYCKHNKWRIWYIHAFLLDFIQQTIKSKTIFTIICLRRYFNVHLIQKITKIVLKIQKWKLLYIERNQPNKYRVSASFSTLLFILSDVRTYCFRRHRRVLLFCTMRTSSHFIWKSIVYIQNKTMEGQNKEILLVNYMVFLSHNGIIYTNLVSCLKSMVTL